jgi:hypothetical protein
VEVVGELAAATDVRDTRVSCSKGRSVAGVRNAVNIAVGDADLSCPKVDVQALGVLNELEHPARDGTIKTPPTWLPAPNLEQVERALTSFLGEIGFYTYLSL